MFLLPAIGAWISDGLVLYIYFSDKSGNATSTGNSNGGGGRSLNNFEWCGNNGPCRRIQELISPFPNHVDGSSARREPIISAFPYLPNEQRVLGSDVEGGISLSSAKPHHKHKHTNDEDSSFAPQEESSKAEHGASTPGGSSSNGNNGSGNDKVGISASAIESKTTYLSVLAFIRLILLTFPLSYAAYSGTRVPCVVVQFLFHGISSMVVVSHMLAVLIIEDPMGDMPMPGDDGSGVDPSGDPGGGGASQLMGTNTADDGYINGDAWTLLSLSLVSILLHFLIVLHVRSTGPVQDGLYEEKRKRKQLAYAMAARSNGALRGIGGKRAGLKGSEHRINGHHNDDEEEFVDESPLLLPEGRPEASDQVNNGGMTFKERFMCLPDQYEAWVSDTQTRFDAAQRMWAERLEIMTQSLQQNNMNNSAHGENPGRAVAVQSSPSRNHESSNLIANAINTAASNATKLVKPDPFRVLLQLFAYEDVWSGAYSRLDLAFSSEGGKLGQSNDGDFVSSEGSAALSFYAPQLLSFLLHGAFFEISSKLEEWILKKCGQDLHFAHRCFWFLRSWCLGSSSQVHKSTSHARSLSSSSIGGGLGVVDLSLEPGLDGNQLRGVESNLYLSSCQGLLPAAPPLYSPKGDDTTTSSGIDPPGWDTYSDLRDSSNSKFSPDEQVLIEQLLRRVIERGSRPATVAQYGSIDGRISDDYHSGDVSNGFSCSPSALATAVEQGLVPIDPRTGCHSSAHLDCITSQHKHGFLPLSNSGEPYRKANPSNDAASLFFAAPIFLDALLSIADDLMNTDRSNRTTELRKRLRSLEVELLPSNVVYLPLQNMQHRVWRIVADESLALSTNERVPCIITLEVIDCEVPSSSNLQLNQVPTTESAVTASWVSTPREPQRHSTLIDKVAKRFEDTIEHLSHHGDGKSNVLERRLSDFLALREGSWKKSDPLYTTVNSYDDDEIDYRGQDEEMAEARELGDLQTPSKSNGTNEDLLLQLCPPPPLDSSPSPGKVNEAPLTPVSPTPAPPMDDVQQSPMGQWSTPKKKGLDLRKRNLTSIEGIAEEDTSSDDVEISPQAKQRKRVAFPPSATKMTRSESFGDEPRMKGPVAPEDTDVSALTGVAPTVVFREDWKTKTERLRKSSIYGSHPGWRLMPILIKSNDDLRQEQLASQLIQRMATILARARVPVWLFPYEIVALTGRGGSKCPVGFLMRLLCSCPRCSNTVYDVSLSH